MTQKQISQTKKQQSEKTITQKEREIVKGLDPETKEKIMTPRNDLIFKKLFGSVGREAIIKDFLEAILEIQIKSLTLGKYRLYKEGVDTRNYGRK